MRTWSVAARRSAPLAIVMFTLGVRVSPASTTVLLLSSTQYVELAVAFALPTSMNPPPAPVVEATVWPSPVGAPARAAAPPIPLNRPPLPDERSRARSCVPVPAAVRSMPSKAKMWPLPDRPDTPIPRAPPSTDERTWNRVLLTDLTK